MANGLGVGSLSQEMGEGSELWHRKVALGDF